MSSADGQQGNLSISYEINREGPDKEWKRAWYDFCEGYNCWRKCLVTQDHLQMVMENKISWIPIFDWINRGINKYSCKYIKSIYQHTIITKYSWKWRVHECLNLEKKSRKMHMHTYILRKYIHW